MYDQIGDNLDDYGVAFDSCCESLCSLLDDLLENLDDWIDVTVTDWSATYTDFLCQEQDIEDVGYEAMFDDYQCQSVELTTTTTTALVTTTTTVNPAQIDWLAQFANYLCQEVDDPDAEPPKNEKIPTFEAVYSSFLCEMVDNPFVTTTTTTANPLVTTTTTTAVAPGTISFSATYEAYLCEEKFDAFATTTTTTASVDETTEFETSFVNYRCQMIWEVTTTTTTQASTTTTSIPVSTTTTTVVACGVPVSGEGGFPSIYSIYLGANTGTIQLSIDAKELPDKFIVEFDGQKVIDTGYCGNAQLQSQLYDALAALSAPPELITGGSTGQFTFNKDTTTEYAIVKVYAPMEESKWDFTLSCPEATTTTTTDNSVIFELLYTDYLCEQEDRADVTTTTTTAAPTTTTTTATPTTTTTTTQSGIVGEWITGEQGYPHIFEVNLGGGTGEITFEYDSILVPDKFVVEYNGSEVINTGYRGDSGFQDILDAALASYGASPETIINGTTGTNSFNKTDGIDVAIVKVFAPIEETEWRFRINGVVVTTTTTPPVTTTTTTSTPVTTTTTTAVPATTTTTAAPATTTTTTGAISSCAGFGSLYNWYAATDVRNIANDGWHIPTNDEYKTLLVYVDPDAAPNSNDAGWKLKESGTVYWNTDNGTNDVNFNGRGGGLRTNGGEFYSLKSSCYFWTTDVHPDYTDRAMRIVISDSISQLGISWDEPGNQSVSADVFKSGLSLRLVKDSTTLTHGQTGTYTGNDGKTYRTICIGTQEWIADNLVETQYRNGDTIPTVTDDTTWSNLTTGAKCAYDNDESNACYPVTTTTTAAPVTTTTTTAAPISIIAGTDYQANWLYTSVDETNWLTQSVGNSNQQVREILYENGVWLLGGYFPDVAWADQDTMFYSTDGQNWTGMGLSVFSTQCNRIVNGNGTYVAVGKGTNTIAYCTADPTNPANWTGLGAIIFTGSYAGYAVAYGNGMFIALGDPGSAAIATSPDGVNWTARGNVFSYFGTDAAYDGVGRWVASGVGSSGSLAYSDDNGQTWTQVDQVFPYNNGAYAVAYGNGKWVAGGTGGSNSIAYSTDGQNWTGVGEPHGLATCYVVIFSNGYFYAAGAGVNTGVLKSADGISWTKLMSTGIPTPINIIGTKS